MAFPASHHASFGTSVKSEPSQDTRQRDRQNDSVGLRSASQSACADGGGGGGGVCVWQTSVVAVVVVRVSVSESESGELHQRSSTKGHQPAEKNFGWRVLLWPVSGLLTAVAVAVAVAVLVGRRS
jgi:hypothetical protein